jgi:hypothetical protein
MPRKDALTVVVLGLGICAACGDAVADATPDTKVDLSCWKTQETVSIAGAEAEAADLASPAAAAATAKEAQKTQQDQSTGVLQKFSVTSGSGSTIVTTHIATAYAPMFVQNTPSSTTKNNAIDRGHLWNDLGLDLSASLNAQNQSNTSYLRQELLMRYGGVGNLYFTLAGRNPCNALYSWGDRMKSLDRIYFMDQIQGRQPATSQQLMAFVSHGLGIKALKEQVSGTSYTGLGTAYLGLGFDGPLFDFSDSDSKTVTHKPPAAAGFISFEVYAAENLGSKAAFVSMFASDNVRRNFASWGANFHAAVGGCFDLSISYASPFDAFTRKYLPGTTLLTFGYNRPSDSNNKSCSSTPPSQKAASS